MKYEMLFFVRLGALQDGNMFCASSEEGVIVIYLVVFQFFVRGGGFNL